MQHGALEYLCAEGISVPHCFTTRLGGVSTGTQSSLNLAIGRGDTLENVEQNLRILAQELDFDPKRLVMTHQNHSNLVRVVTDADALGLCHRAYPHCDGLVTATPGTALLIFTADCTPLLLHDPVTGAVGAAHAGWRGTAQNIAGQVVEAMVRAFGSKPEDIRAAIGPNIGQCHFETDRDVPEALVETYAVNIDPVLHKEVLERYAALELKPYGGFINPEIVPVKRGGKVVDYRIEYCDDFLKQQLDYGKRYRAL